jgi:hypothetical protein
MRKFLIIPLLLISAGERIHTVKKGDTLWDIAGFYYGNPFFWVAIWKVNIDKIKDPHWIYPGQKFVIPEVPPTEMVLYPQYKMRPREIIKVKEKVPAPEKVVEVKVIKPPIPAVAKELALSAGFIHPKAEVSYLGRIIGSEQENDLFYFYEKIYINKGELDGVKPGDEFLIFRFGKEIKSKRRGMSLGTYVWPLGKIRIIRTESNSALAEVFSAYDFIREGDYFKEIEYPEMPYDVKLIPVENRKIEGEIVYIKEREGKIIIPYNIVFIDIGEADGVKIGDLFEIYREGKEIKDPDTGKKIKLPYIFIGTLQVVNVKKYASSCYLRATSYHNLKIGDKVRLVGEVAEK